MNKVIVATTLMIIYREPQSLSAPHPGLNAFPAWRILALG